jgi:hypothetical protein
MNCSAVLTSGPTDLECSRTGPVKFNTRRANLVMPDALLYGRKVGCPRIPNLKVCLSCTSIPTSGTLDVCTMNQRLALRPDLTLRNMRVMLPSPMMSR